MGNSKSKNTMPTKKFSSELSISVSILKKNFLLSQEGCYFDNDIEFVKSFLI